MKKKEILGAVLVATLFVGVAVGCKLFNSDNSAKVDTKPQNNSTLAVKDMTGEKTKDLTNGKKIDYKKLYSEANKEGNTDGNINNLGFIAQQDKWLYFRDKGLCMSLADLKTGWKRINNDECFDIQVIGDWIYYLDNAKNLIRIKPDGSGKKVINNLVNYYKVTNNCIYYEASKKLYKMNLDGTDKNKIMDNECAAFSIQDNDIYYIDYWERKLHKIFADGSCDQCLTTDRCATFQVKGEWIYCMGRDRHYLFKIKLDGTSNTILLENFVCFCIDKDNIYYGVNSGASLDIYRQKLDGTEKTKLDSIKMDKKLINTQILMYAASEDIYTYFARPYLTSGKVEQAIYRLKK